MFKMPALELDALQAFNKYWLITFFFSNYSNDFYPEL